MADPTPEIAAAIVRLAEEEVQLRIALGRAQLCAAAAEQHKQRIAALALAQQALREWVSREDRERALALAMPDDYEHPGTHEEDCTYCVRVRSARRLLKLEDRDA